MSKVAIQGMPGSYTEQALVEIEPDITPEDTLYLETFDEVFESVSSRRAARAVVAFSNTRIDSIQRPAELLLGHESMGDYWVDGGVTLPIHHCLAASAGTSINQIATIISQPEALRQCGNALRELNGQVTVIESKDTALSAQQVAMEGSERIAAICSERAAKLYGLDVLRRRIQDDDINLTRFVRFTRMDQAQLVDERPDNSIVVLTLPQRVGSLDDALSTFTSHGVDIRTLRSRNIPNTDMQVDIIAEIRRGMNEEMRDVIGDLAKIGATVTFIGTYADKSVSLQAEKTANIPARVSVAEEVQRFDTLYKQLKGE
jgi:prephenate dehydratase